MSNERMAALQKLSRRMKLMCMVALAIVLLAALIALQGLATDPRATLAGIDGIRLYSDRIGFWQLAGIATINGVSILLVSAGLFALWEMFSEFADGEVLSRVPARHMRQAGKFFFATAIWGVFAHMATVLLATMNNPVGERQLSIAVNSEQLFPILLAGVLFAVGHVLTAATEVDEENKGFV